MSKELQQQPQQSEEVDLGQLFKLIGNAFDRFFKFIGSIFTSLFNVVISVLIHFYKRFFWYAGAVVIGLVLGFFLDKSSDKLYGANMFIETNFESARQVYEDIKQFHQLANVDQDSLELARKLKISPSEAASIKGFYIEPDVDENAIAEKYSSFYMHLDSLSRTEMTYDRYSASLTPYNFKVHRIGVASTDKTIYKKIEKAFLKEVMDNDYLNEVVAVNQLTLEEEERALKDQIKITDSLVNEYLKIRVNESLKEPLPGSGTNLYMGNAEAASLIVDESRVVQKRLDYERAIREVKKNKVEEKQVVNVLADFPVTGYDITEWTDKMKFVLPLLFLAITMVTFTFLGLGDYLKAKSEEN